MAKSSSSTFRWFLHYILAITLPPLAVWVVEGFTLRLLICIVATFIFSIPSAIYLALTKGYTPLLIFANCCLILPGSIYAIWVILDHYAPQGQATTPSSLEAPAVAQPHPHRLASAYQQGILTIDFDSPISSGRGSELGTSQMPSYKGKYSPITISSHTPTPPNITDTGK